MIKPQNRCYLLLAVFILEIWIAISGCSHRFPRLGPKSKGALEKIAPSAYPDFLDDMGLDGLEHGISQSLRYYHRIAPSRQFQFGNDQFDARHMIRSLEHFLAFIHTNPDTQDIKALIVDHYWVYRSRGAEGTGRVLFTGYYEPILRGSTRQTAFYRYPVYARPEDIVSVDLSLFSEKFSGKTIVGRVTDHRVVPYHDRRTIESDQVLRGKAPVLAWIHDPVDLFFLQIQGSGKIYLTGGRVLNVHYHMANGHPYRSIGKLLIDKGKIQRSEMSMQAIRSYLSTHPKEIDAILNYNPSYVFFKTEHEAPLGFLEVKLTPARSIALDRRIFPHGALGFIKAKKPLINGSADIQNWVSLSQFVVNQDTGGAIRGPGRADIFWGNGPYAEVAAGHLRHHGDLYFLVLKTQSK